MGRVLDIGTTRYTEILVKDEPGQGGACHHYEIMSVDPSERTAPFCRINFQEGPTKEYGVNGIYNEDLIAVVIDRLRGFQSGDYSCQQNALAITKLEEALHWLNDRTQERMERGVEGTNTP